MGFNYTGRICDKKRCLGKLRDFLLDWNDPLPEKELSVSEKHCEKADLCVTLGTSLRVEPACNLPFLCQKNGGKSVVVNLQETPFDNLAYLNIRTYADKLMKDLMIGLNIPIPILRIDQTFFVQLTLERRKGRLAKDRAGNPIFAQHFSLLNQDKTHCRYIKSLTMKFIVDIKTIPERILFQIIKLQI